jgi:hypothetical protein
LAKDGVILDHPDVIEKALYINEAERDLTYPQG